MKRIHSCYALLASCVLMVACGESPSGPSEPAAVQISGTLPASAPVSSAVSASVLVTDNRNQAVSGVTVSFQVTAGGGTISTPTATTNANGIATLPAWTLGPNPGVNTLTAQVADLAPLTLSITTISVGFTKISGDNSTCPIGTSGCRFAVRVQGPDIAPVAGETIAWTGPGGATLATNTNAAGIAVAPNLGTNSSVASHVQTARRVSTGEELSFSYGIAQGGQYNIEIRYVGTVAPAFQAAFDAARARWQQVVFGNLPSVALNNIPADVCEDAEGNVVVNTPPINETVDDLLVYVQIDSIDGPGRVLGSAGPCFIRQTSRIPVLGIMRLDSADLALMQQNGLLGDVILHELGHVLGFPGIWDDPLYNLLVGAGTTNPYFTGGGAMSQFTLAGGTPINGVGVPVENTGGDGTKDSHWRESVLHTELMTGFVSAGSNPLSTITIGSLRDIGYQVNYDVADPYSLPAAGAMGRWSSQRVEIIEKPLARPRVVR